MAARSFLQKIAGENDVAAIKLSYLDHKEKMIWRPPNHPRATIVREQLGGYPIVLLLPSHEKTTSQPLGHPLATLLQEHDLAVARSSFRYLCEKMFFGILDILRNDKNNKEKYSN